MKSRIFFSALFLAVMTISVFAQPELVKKINHSQLQVQGKPFLMLAGELGNSSASSMKYMEPCWESLKLMNLNTVLIPLYWELLEKEEDRYDFSLVDALIDEARNYNLRIVFLWFGSWKNSMSCYAPGWVKEDYAGYPRARRSNGEAVEILSPFYEENLQADLAAFKRLMEHIKKVDIDEQTIIMIQVENEIGMIPEARDHSEAANKAFAEKVPEELITYLKSQKDDLIPEFKELWAKTGFRENGSWEEVFGKDLHTDELFMAWYYARYVQKLVSAGKEIYNLPMYVNAALIRPGKQPGEYPSAGPLPHLMDIWHAGTPDIDILAPDIYFPNLQEWCTLYDRSGNPLFIPEAGNNQSMCNAFYAIGEHNALGYSPFSIESLPDPTDNEVSRAYHLLGQLTPLILDKQGAGDIYGILLDSADQSVDINTGEYILHVKHEYSWPYAARKEGAMPRYGGLIIRIGEGKFLVAGSGMVITFESQKGEGYLAGIKSIDEVEYEDGEWIFGRRLNGDQSHQGRHLQLPGNGEYGAQLVQLYHYK